MIDDVFVREKDIHVELSPYLKKQAVNGFFISIMHFGNTYYIPLSRGLKALLHIRIKNGKPEFPDYNSERSAYDILQNLVSSVYLQIRDTVGHEVEQHIHQELKDSFSKMFENVIEAKVGQAFGNLDRQIANPKLCPDFEKGKPCSKEILGDFYCGDKACKLINGKRVQYSDH